MRGSTVRPMLAFMTFPAAADARRQHPPDLCGRLRAPVRPPVPEDRPAAQRARSDACVKRAAGTSARRSLGR